VPVAAPYAHVTAPLRRLADRYATEVCLSLSDGHAVPDWVREALPTLPELMATADRRASAAERGAVDLAEAVLLAGREGEDGDGGAEQRPPSGTIAIDSPAVRARSEGNLPLGERIRIRLAIAAETVSIRSGGERCRRICRMQVRICPAM
jgi:exoribonuclease R